MTSSHLQTLASRFSEDIIHQLDGSDFFGGRDFYTDKELTWIGFLGRKDNHLYALIDKPDQSTIDFNYNGHDRKIINYYDKQRIKSIIQSPMFLWLCFKYQDDFPTQWGCEKLRELFDTKELPFSSMVDTAFVFQQTSKWDKKKRDKVLPSFLKANSWQKQVMIYNTPFKEKWMFEWDIPSSFCDALLRQASRAEIIDDTYLLGYGSKDGETLKELVSNHPELGNRIAQEYGYQYPRDRQYFHDIVKHRLVAPYRMNPNDVKEQLLYSLKNHLNSDEDQSKCVISYRTLRDNLAFGKEHFPNERSQALRMYINHLYAHPPHSETVAERLNMLSKCLILEEEESISDMFSDVSHSEEFLETLQQRPFVATWQNILEKIVIGQDLKGNTFSKGRKM